MCHGKGHYARDCWYKDGETANKSEFPNAKAKAKAKGSPKKKAEKGKPKGKATLNDKQTTFITFLKNYVQAHHTYFEIQITIETCTSHVRQFQTVDLVVQTPKIGSNSAGSVVFARSFEATFGTPHTNFSKNQFLKKST